MAYFGVFRSFLVEKSGKCNKYCKTISQFSKNLVKKERFSQKRKILTRKERFWQEKKRKKERKKEKKERM